MISKEQVQELRKMYQNHWFPLDPMLRMSDLLDTIEALWKVAEAAKKWRWMDLAKTTKKEQLEADLAIADALATLEEEK